MGVCASDDKQHRTRNFRMSMNQIEEDKTCEKYNSKLCSPKKNSNNNYNNDKTIEISLNSKKTIIKSIGQIKGESVSIKNNLNCIIMIMDYSYSINIQNCQNCSIFVAPTQTSITVQDCQDLNLICVSKNLKVLNSKQSNLYYFVSNYPIIESCQKINLGNFFVQYMELHEMFNNSKLNIWNNKWSCFEEKGNNIDITYSNEKIKQKVVDIFMPIFPQCYINVDQFQFIPFTYGKSLQIVDSFINFLIILKQEDLPEGDILKMLLPEEIENYRVKLISTMPVKDKSDTIQKVIKKLEPNKENSILINYLMRINTNQEGTESLHGSRMKNNPSYNSINKSRLNEFDLSNNEGFGISNFKFLNKGDFLFLWFINENEDFGEIYDYFNTFFEPLYIGKILKEQFNCDELSFRETLQQIFEFQK
jgi:hypothetical protein